MAVLSFLVAVAIGAWFWWITRDAETFTYDGVERDVLVHVPDDLPSGAPLLIGLHGYTDRAPFIREYSNMDGQADEHGFVVAYPQGTTDRLGLPFWNANLDLGREPDDLGFLVWLADRLVDEHDLDPDRVYVFGLSNGGFMSYHLACNATDVFAGLASVVGTMSGEDWETCDPSEPIDVLHIHGTADRIVPHDGTLAARRGGWGGAPGVETIVAWWADQFDLGQPAIDTDGDTVVTTWSGSSAQVELRLIDGFGHRWPDGGTGTDATEEIVAFFGLDRTG